MSQAGRTENSLVETPEIRMIDSMPEARGNQTVMRGKGQSYREEGKRVNNRDTVNLMISHGGSLPWMIEPHVNRHGMIGYGKRKVLLGNFRGVSGMARFAEILFRIKYSYSTVIGMKAERCSLKMIRKTERFTVIIPPLFSGNDQSREQVGHL